MILMSLEIQDGRQITQKTVHRQNDKYRDRVSSSMCDEVKYQKLMYMEMFLQRAERVNPLTVGVAYMRVFILY